MDYAKQVRLSIVLALCLGTGWGSVSGQLESNGNGEGDVQRTDPAVSGQFTLPIERQEYLWDIEHLAFVLSQDVFPVFREAIRDGRTERLLDYLSPGFRGRLFSGEGSVIRKGPVRVHTWQRAGGSREVDGPGFVEALATHGRAFARVEKVAPHITSLLPDEEGDLKGRWSSHWEISIKGILPGGGRAEHRLDGLFRLARLSGEIGSASGWIESFEVTRSWRVSASRPLMEEITGRTGIAVDALTDNWNKPGPPYYAVNARSSLLDLDQDGRTDFVIFDYPTRKLFLYRGLGDGRFEDVTKAAGLIVAGSPMFVADLDNDGFEDLVLRLDEHDLVVYRNRGDGTFQWLGPSEHNLQNLNLGRSSPVFAVADYDGDGRVDIYVGQAGEAPPEELQQARWVGDRSSPAGLLLRNLGSWQFEDVTEAAGLNGEYVDSMAAVWLDLEPDGDPDLFVANHMGENLLWENRGDGTFSKRPQPPGFGGFSMGATAGDLDGDGDPDLYVANMYSSAGSRIMGILRPSDYPEGVFDLIRGFITGNELYRNEARELHPLGVAAGVANSGWSYGPAVVDLDGDGSLDLYSPAGYQSVSREEPDG